MKLPSGVAGLLTWYKVRAGLMLGAVARVLEKADWEKLSKDMQALYVEKDGKYALDLTGDSEDAAGLKSALEKERKAHRDSDKALKDLQQRFDGVDPEAMREIMKRFEDDEDAKLMKAGKIDEVINKRVEQMRKEHVKQLAEKDKLIEAANVRGKKHSDKVLENAIRAAASKAGLHAHAIEDALYRGRSVFTLNEDGEAVSVDGSGHARIGKDGKSPYSPTEWLDSMKETAPHWFPSQNGGSGSRGDGNNGGGQGGGKRQVTRKDFEAMNPADRVITAKEMRDGKTVIVDNPIR